MFNYIVKLVYRTNPNEEITKAVVQQHKIPLPEGIKDDLESRLEKLAALNSREGVRKYKREILSYLGGLRDYEVGQYFGRINKITVARLQLLELQNKKDDTNSIIDIETERKKLRQETEANWYQSLLNLFKKNA